jgi:hypothetical protein
MAANVCQECSYAVGGIGMGRISETLLLIVVLVILYPLW